MTNLTEQWNKGKLPEGMYYIEYSGADKIDYWFGNYWEDGWNDSVDEVLAEVPSYEEWRDIKDDLATCDKDLNNVCEQKEELYEENTKLKELLKEAREVLKMVDTYCGDYDSINGFLIVEKINQVLGEE